jgi:hypothetical protein
LPTPSLACPKEDLKYYEKAPKAFRDKILASTQFDNEEKKFLFETAAFLYPDNLNGNEWINCNVSMQYLGYFSMKHPELHFSTIRFFDSQFIDKNGTRNPGQPVLSDDIILDQIVETCQGFSLFGHCLELNENHRTAFFIDLENNTVEFYNSFGSDHSMEKTFQKLANKLSQKHGRQFKYLHKTKDLKLQPDTYQCGIWAPTLIVEIAKQGKDFNPATMKGFGIKTKRNTLFDSVFKDRFYCAVGNKRLIKFLEAQGKNSVTHPIWDVKELGYESLRSTLLYEWGKTGTMPEALLRLIEESERK